MHEDHLAHAIEHLTDELRALRKERQQELVTRRDLAAMETRLLKAVSGLSDAEMGNIAAKLRASTDVLEGAVKENSPQ